MKLLLIRHGETDWNKARRVQGRTDVPLNETGRAQAARIAAQLDTTKIDAVYSSPLSRAYETAELIAAGRGLEIKKADELLEIQFGLWEGKTINELMVEYPLFWRDWSWLNRKEDCEKMHAESAMEIQRRSMSVVERIRKECGDGDTALIVSHTMPIKLIIAYYLQMPLEAISRLRIENCSINMIWINKEGKGRLDKLNCGQNEGK